MELFEQYTQEQPLVDWKSMFECLQDYRAKAIEQRIFNLILSFLLLKIAIFF